MTITCTACGKICSGEVLKVQDRHFHIECFTCKVCRFKLLSGGYFMKNEEYYCSKDYHTLFGTKCKVCSNYVEGRVVTALGESYHPQCFTCNRCREEIRSGTVVTYNDRQEILCQKCTDVAFVEGQEDHTPQDSREQTPRPTDRLLKSDEEANSTRSSPSLGLSPNESIDQGESIDFSKLKNIDPITRSRLGRCAGCREAIKSSQSLIALDRHWHLFCFVCYHCQNLLNTEYMTKDEKAYCYDCYNNMYGAQCEVCGSYIIGKVVQAGNKCFHAACAVCQRCNNGFKDGEDMCMSDEMLWHLLCDSTTTGPNTLASYHNNYRISTERKNSTSSEYSGPTSPSLQAGSSSHLESENESNGSQQTLIFPLKDIQLIGNIRLPKNVNRTRLEDHLSDDDFIKCLGVSRDVFHALPTWKQVDLKKRANIF